MKKKIRRIYFIVFHSHEAKTSLEISHLKCFLPTKAFSLSKRFDKFSEILHEIIKKKIPSKISERFFRRNVQFSPFHTWNKIFWMFLWSVSHRHTKKTYKFSPIFFPLTWRKKKYLHFCCHSKLFSWKKKKKKFFSLSFTLEKTKFSWKCVYTRFHKRGNKIQSHMKEKKSPENSPDCFLLLGFTHKKIPLKTISSWKNLQKWNSWKLHTRLILMKNIFSQVHTWKHNN